MHDDHFADFDEDKTNSPLFPSPLPRKDGFSPQQNHVHQRNEVFSKRIDTPGRTFFVDVKESPQGRFLKISEKSRGKKSTVMMDSGDVSQMIAALMEAQKHLSPSES